MGSALELYWRNDIYCMLASIVNAFGFCIGIRQIYGEIASVGR